MQKVISQDNLLENCRAQGEYLSSLLKERLQGPNTIAASYTFDIRGGGLFWGIEFDFPAEVEDKTKSFGMLVQARALELGLVIMGFTGGANLEGTKGLRPFLCLIACLFLTCSSKR